MPAEPIPSSRRQRLRRRWRLVRLLAVAMALSAQGIALAAAPPAPHGRTSQHPPRAHRAGSPGGVAPRAHTTIARAPFAVGMRVLRLVDTSRSIRLAHGRTAPRTLLTYVRYPALAASPGAAPPGTPLAPAPGPFPLVVFGHGFAVTPQPYARLLDSWARAGYVVAAPVFPLGNANAPGGPDEADLVNQPDDMSFVISRLLAASATLAPATLAPATLAPPAPEPLAGLIDPAHIAVAGQSDGGETALATAYSRRFRDPRVGAAVILSGAEMSGVGGYRFTAPAPPLLAVQGTADTFNEPRYTYAYFHAARRPKYLLRLLGAEHLPPYTRQQPQLSIVERVTIAFLDAYLKGTPGAQQQITALGTVPGTAVIAAAP